MRVITPGREDLAETALLAFGDYNNRLPSDVSHTLQSLVPNKNNFTQDYIKHASKIVLAEQQADTHCE